MPSRLRPTASVATDAILVGDPGRALLLAQDLLEKPKMSNHARGLWGYSGKSAAGDSLTIQSTGMGGPSAAIVLADLAELGVRRAIRIGTCVALDPGCEPGGLLIATEARKGEATFLPDRDLLEGLSERLSGKAMSGAIVSVDGADELPAQHPLILGCDLQTATVLELGQRLGVAVAATLVIEETAGGKRIPDEALAEAATLAGRTASDILSG
jgi:Phosphorylase superfamily